MNAVTLQDLTKHFPAFTLDSISFSVPAGSVMGMIGENGAGKSTTIKLILGLLSPDAGTVTIFGSSGAPDREHIGVVFDECCFPDTLSAQDIDRILGMSYRTWSHKAFADYLARFSLPYRKAIKSYSRGMKMKLSIAAALSHGAELLIHVGVDTVDMGGDGFTLHVSEGDKVRRGDALVTFDANKIAAAGHPTTTMLIVTDPGEHSLTTHTGRDGKHGATPVAELG